MRLTFNFCSYCGSLYGMFRTRHRPIQLFGVDKLLIEIHETMARPEGCIEGLEGVVVISAQSYPLGSLPAQFLQGGHLPGAVEQALFAALHACPRDDSVDRIPHPKHRSHWYGIGLEATSDAAQRVCAEIALRGGDVTGEQNPVPLQSIGEVGVVALGTIQEALSPPCAGFEQ